MLVALTFQAKPGKAAEMRSLLDNPDGGRRVAKAMGAHRNLLLWHGDRMVRIMEFEDGVEPIPLSQVARQDEKVHSFLKRLGGLTQPAFDPDDEVSMNEATGDAMVQVLYDVRV